MPVVSDRDEAEQVLAMVRDAIPEDIRSMQTDRFSDHTYVQIRINHRDSNVRRFSSNITMNDSDVKAVTTPGMDDNKRKFQLLQDKLRSEAQGLQRITNISEGIVQGAERNTIGTQSQDQGDSVVQDLRGMVQALSARLNMAQKNLEDTTASDVKITPKPLTITCTVIAKRPNNTT